MRNRILFTIQNVEPSTMTVNHKQYPLRIGRGFKPVDVMIQKYFKNKLHKTGSETDEKFHERGRILQLTVTELSSLNHHY